MGVSDIIVTKIDVVGNFWTVCPTFYREKGWYGCLNHVNMTNQWKLLGCYDS